MGNNDVAKVHGKGSVELQFTSGKKLLLVNVLHVPDVRKNLMSANMLCKKGFKTVLESEKLILTKNGVFVGKGYSCNGMFKLSINKIGVSAYTVDCRLPCRLPFTLWHERLGHINYRCMKYMNRQSNFLC